MTTAATTTDVLVLEARFLWDARFRVGSGQADESVDDALDPTTTLAESSVKNRLKAAALHLGVPRHLVREVFEAGVWNLLVEQPTVEIADVATISIDPVSRTVVPTGLTTRHDARATGPARLDFSLLRPLGAEALRRHVLVLLLAGRACKTVGGNRNRGLGAWDVRLVSCAVDDVRQTRLREQLHNAGIRLEPPRAPMRRRTHREVAR